MEKINVNLSELPESGKVIFEVREGEALPLYHPLNVTLRGDIQSVKEFIAKNYNAVVKDEIRYPGIIKLSKDNQNIVFIDDPKAQVGQVAVTATLIPNRKLEALGINKDKWFDQKGISKLIRNSVTLFQDPSIVRGLMKTLEELTLAVETVITDNSDKRGNEEKNYKRVIKDKKGILPEFILLFCPLFEGMEPIELKLEIEVDVVSNRPAYAFYCLEMDLLLEAQLNLAFDNNMTEYMYKHFVVLNV